MLNNAVALYSIENVVQTDYVRDPNSKSLP